MKTILCVLLTISTLSMVGQTAEKNLIQKTFDDYKSAILNDEPERALSVIDSRTKNYYVQLLKEIKTGDSVRINSLSIIDKITVLGIRSMATKDEIRKMKETDAFAYAVKKGMVGKNSVSNNSIGEITVDKSFAKAQIMTGSEPTPLYFNFYKEDGKWKMDLTALFPVTNIALKNMVAESGKTENEFLFNILEALRGRKVTSEIWQPVE